MTTEPPESSTSDIPLGVMSTLRQLGRLQKPFDVGRDTATKLASQFVNTSIKTIEPIFGAEQSVTEPPAFGASEAPPNENPYRAFERLLESIVGLGRTSLAGLIGASSQPSTPEAVRIGPITAGSTATAHLWLHNQGSASHACGDLLVSDLTGHSGGQLAAEHVHIPSETVLEVPAGTSRAMEIQVHVPANTAPDTYRGTILVRNELVGWLPIEVLVTSNGN